jgi:hypothetical protein
MKKSQNKQACLPNGFGLLFLHTLKRAGEWHKQSYTPAREEYNKDDRTGF